jgi:hypothetical protein
MWLQLSQIDKRCVFCTIIYYKTVICRMLSTFFMKKSSAALTTVMHTGKPLLWNNYFIVTSSYFFLQQNETGFNVDQTSAQSVPATYVTFNELECTPPTVGSYEVKIRNNGANQASGSSGPAYFLVYDSLCYDCNINTLTCIQKVNHLTWNYGI